MTMRALVPVDANRRRIYAIAAGVVLAAWLALAIWSISPYAEWLDHTQMEAIAAPPIIRLAVFTLGWTLMIIAMMLPGTLLLLARCLENRSFSAKRIVPLILAYLVVWVVFGVFIYGGDSLLHELVDQVPALAGVIAPGVLLLAGVYQLTPMKRICLARCRPDRAAFEPPPWSSRPDRWTMGLRHGTFCLGSCWALMLLMFASGGVHLVWMLALGAVMAAERTLFRGTLLVRVLGFTLILCSFVTMLR